MGGRLVLCEMGEEQPETAVLPGFLVRLRMTHQVVVERGQLAVAVVLDAMDHVRLGVAFPTPLGLEPELLEHEVDV